MTRRDLHRRRFGSRRHPGQALLAALWILVVLTVTVWSFALAVRLETRIAANYGEEVQAEAAAEAGLVRVLKAVEAETLGEPGSPPARGSWEAPVGGRSGYRAWLIDEGGKLNLNAAAPDDAKEATHNSKTLALALQRMLGIGLSDALFDWTDKDAVSRPFGAEADYYALQGGAAAPRNAPVAIWDELFLIRGFTPARLEAPPADASGAGEKKLRELVTLYSIEDNSDAAGLPRVNLRRASREQFQEHLGDVLSESEIDAILRFRSGVRDPMDNPVPDAPPVPDLNPQPDRKPAQGLKPGPVKRQELRTTGDLLAVPMLRDRVRKVADRVTLDDEPTLRGRINLNTAPPEVLRTLPGMNATIVADILAYRDGASGPFRTVGDLLDLPSVPNEVYRDVVDCLTVRSNAMTIVSEGWAGRPAIRRRVEALVIRVTEKPALLLRQPGGSSPGLGASAAVEARRVVPPVRRAFVIRKRYL